MNETCVKSIDSEQFLNENEWDRLTVINPSNFLGSLQMLVDPSYGLQTMSDTYIYDEFILVLRG